MSSLRKKVSHRSFQAFFFFCFVCQSEWERDPLLKNEMILHFLQYSKKKPLSLNCSKKHKVGQLGGSESLFARTQSYKYIFSVDLRQARIIDLGLAKNGHMTFIVKYSYN